MSNDSHGQTRGALISFLSLFTSMATLLCCALPALLVTLGLGASLAGLVSAAPWITGISIYKLEIFLISGGLLILSTYLLIRGRKAPCPIDPVKTQACKRLRKLNVIFTLLAWLVYITGFFFAFIAGNFL